MFTWKIAGSIPRRGNENLQNVHRGRIKNYHKTLPSSYVSNLKLAEIKTHVKEII